MGKGRVGKGRTAFTCVSPSPSKIPYGEFSPVRLQTDCRRRPSPLAPLGSMQSTSPNASALYAATAQAALIAVLADYPSQGLPAQSARSRTTGARQSRGPWLASGLCCPAGSSLTMASSALLARRLRWPSTGFSRPRNCSGRPSQKVPNLLRMTVRPCRLPYPGGPRLARGCRFVRGCGLRLGSTGSASTSSCFEAAEFALCYGLAAC
jgi:hypothetical protein